MPSSEAQSRLIRDTYARCGLDLSRKSDRPQYFEAHGTGTPTGDRKYQCCLLLVLSVKVNECLWSDRIADRLKPLRPVLSKAFFFLVAQAEVNIASLWLVASRLL